MHNQSYIPVLYAPPYSILPQHTQPYPYMPLWNPIHFKPLSVYLSIPLCILLYPVRTSTHHAPTRETAHTHTPFHASVAGKKPRNGQDAKTAHLGLSPHCIFIDPQGKWLLGGLSHSVSGVTSYANAMPCHAMPCHAEPCRAMPCHAMPCHAMPCHAMPCHAMPCHAMPCHAMPCHAMPCHARLG